MATQALIKPEEASSSAGVLDCVPWKSLTACDQIDLWARLSRHASEPNVFLESWYLLPSLRHLDPPDTHILRFHVDGKLAGLLPIERSSRYYRYPFPNIGNWQHPNMFCGAPLVARGSEAAFWRALFAWSDRNAGSALFLHLRDQLLSGPLHAALEQVLGEQCRQGEVVHRDDRAMLASSLSPEAYWEASLSGKKRKELRRQANRLAEEGTVAIRRTTEAEDIAAWCQDFLGLEQAGWKGKAGSALACSPQTAAIFAESLAGAAARGQLERLTLTLDDQPIAMLASFLSPPGAFSFKTAFDERFARFSPGVLLQQANLAMLDNPQIAWTDSCAAADHPMIDHIWRERRPIGRVSIAIGGAARRFAFRQLVRAELRR